AIGTTTGNLPATAATAGQLSSCSCNPPTPVPMAAAGRGDRGRERTPTDCGNASVIEPVSRFLRARLAQVAKKPLRGQTGDFFEGSRLRKEMRGARDDLKLARAPQQLKSLLVQLDDDVVVAAHDQQGGRGHSR